MTISLAEAKMNAIILAAGKGSRMNKNCSKPMCMVDGKHLIRHSIDALLSAGIKSIHIVYSSASMDVIKLRIAYPELSFHFQESVTGSLSSFYLATTLCDESFIIMDADLIADPKQIKEMLSYAAQKSEADAYFATIRNNSFNSIRSVAVSVSENRILIFDKSGVSNDIKGEHECFPGGMIYVWHKNPNKMIRDFLKNSESMSAFLKYATQKLVIRPMYIDDLWDVDNEADINRTEALLQECRKHFTKRYKAVAVDLDGTLLCSDQSISDYTRIVFNEIKCRGIKTIISSSRRFQTAEPFYRELGFDACSCAGGSWTISGDQTSFTAPLPTSDGICILEMAKAIHPNIGYSILTTDGFFINTKNRLYPVIRDDYKNVIGRWLRILIYSPEESFIKQLSAKYNGGEVRIQQLVGGDILVQAAGANKLSGLEKIITDCGIKLDEVVYFGDGLDDLPCITHVGLGVAVSNAAQSVKEFAQAICPSNDEHGVAKQLNAMYGGIYE